MHSFAKDECRLSAVSNQDQKKSTSSGAAVSGGWNAIKHGTRSQTSNTFSPGELVLGSKTMPPVEGLYSKDDEKRLLFPADSNWSRQPKQCRICLRTSDSKPKKEMVSPCRCDGSLRHVHLACLTRWIEVSNRGTKRPPKCELCQFTYHRKRPIIPLHLRLPHMRFTDCVLNLLFLFLVTTMLLCGSVVIFYLWTTERRPLMRRQLSSEEPFLNEADASIIIASILFLAALFLALFTQYCAELSVFRLLQRLWSTNRNWSICDYGPVDRTRMGMGEKSSVAVSV